jgi:hypothetical protein
LATNLRSQNYVSSSNFEHLKAFFDDRMALRNCLSLAVTEIGFRIAFFLSIFT